MMKPTVKIILIGSLPLSTRVLRSLVEYGCDVVGVVTEPVRREYVDLFPDPATVEYVHRQGLRRLSLAEVEAMPPASVDLGFSVRAPYILSTRLLSVFKRGVVNFHGGPLPELRGVNCANMAVLSGLGYSGGTLHLMEEKVDVGPILAKTTFPVERTDTAHDVFLKTQAALWEAFRESRDTILDGAIEAISQDALIEGGLSSAYFNRSALKPLKTVEAKGELAELVDRARGLDFPGHEPLRIQSGDRVAFLSTRPAYSGEWARRESWTARQKTLFGKVVPGAVRRSDSPIERLPGLSRRLDIDLRVKRDDLLGGGGGNKERKAVEIFRGAQADGANAVVTTGGLESNHCRVTAQWAARLGWPCHLVLHGTAADAANSPNVGIMRLLGATIEVVESSSIRASIEAAKGRFIADGFTPAIVPGGGHSPAGVTAYVAAALEAEEQCREMHWLPDVILHASGTGGTQAGLTIGYAKARPEAEVHGISVARARESGLAAVREAATEWLRANVIESEEPTFFFHDEWVGDGYGQHCHAVREAVAVAAGSAGLLTDYTYTGKAMRALMDMVQGGRIKSGTRVLFWHTGGLVNCISDHGKAVDGA